MFDHKLTYMYGKEKKIKYLSFWFEHFPMSVYIFLKEANKPEVATIIQSF